MGIHLGGLFPVGDGNEAVLVAVHDQNRAVVLSNLVVDVVVQELLVVDLPDVLAEGLADFRDILHPLKLFPGILRDAEGGVVQDEPPELVLKFRCGDACNAPSLALAKKKEAVRVCGGE